MRSLALIALLAVLAQGHAEERDANDMNDSQSFVDPIADKLMIKLADKMITRVKASLLRDADLDSAMLKKPGHLSLPSDHQEGEGEGQEEGEETGETHALTRTGAFVDCNRQEEPALAFVLCLRGGIGPRIPGSNTHHFMGRPAWDVLKGIRKGRRYDKSKDSIRRPPPATSELKQWKLRPCIRRGTQGHMKNMPDKTRRLHLWSEQCNSKSKSKHRSAYKPIQDAKVKAYFEVIRRQKANKHM